MEEQENGELRKLLQENIKLSKENQRLLKKMRSSQRWGGFFRLLYWIIILVSIFGAYYFIQPFIDIFQQNINTVQTGIDTLESVGQIDIPSLLENFR